MGFWIPVGIWHIGSTRSIIWSTMKRMSQKVRDPVSKKFGKNIQSMKQIVIMKKDRVGQIPKENVIFP